VNEERREAQIAHARMRAWCRFECDLTPKELIRLAKAVEKRHYPLVANHSREKSVWCLMLPNGRTAHAVFDSETRMIATFFPPAWGAGNTEGVSRPLPAAA
jgi:hypothetical protein